MRLLLVFLIILNLLYAGWEYLNPAATSNALPPMADNLQTLELLREMKAEEAVLTEAVVNTGESIDAEAGTESGSTAIEPNVAVQEVTNITRCYTLGPFKDEGIMQQLRESLAQHVRELVVRKRTESEKHRYWVYIPAFANRRQAKQMANKLREEKFKDFYIVLSGQSKNSISLGHFSEPVHANRRLKQVVGMGLDAEIKVLYRDYDVYWLDYQISSDKSEPDFSMDEYQAEGVSQIIRNCNGV